MINGSKMWITNAEHAGVFLVFANVEPEKVTVKNEHIVTCNIYSMCQCHYMLVWLIVEASNMGLKVISLK